MTKSELRSMIREMLTEELLREQDYQAKIIDLDGFEGTAQRTVSDYLGGLAIVANDGITELAIIPKNLGDITMRRSSDNTSRCFSFLLAEKVPSDARLSAELRTAIKKLNQFYLDDRMGMSVETRCSKASRPDGTINIWYDITVTPKTGYSFKD